MGILLAAELADSYEMRNPEDGLARRLDEAFLSCGLPIGCPFRVSAMTEIMRKDKKAGAGKVHFVLPFEVGDVRVIDFTVEDVTRLLSVK
jgi:3-dehydroquinate synthetase